MCLFIIQKKRKEKEKENKIPISQKIKEKENKNCSCPKRPITLLPHVCLIFYSRPPCCIHVL